jgi:hypothetical protein
MAGHMIGGQDGRISADFSTDRRGKGLGRSI